jgi:hypothetical protein
MIDPDLEAGWVFFGGALMFCALMIAIAIHEWIHKR